MIALSNNTLSKVGYKAPEYGLSEYQQEILLAVLDRFIKIKNNSDIDLSKYGFSSLEEAEERLNRLKNVRPSAAKELEKLLYNSKSNVSDSPKGLLIEALAGTGKSTILVEIAKLADAMGFDPSSIRLIVFGKKNTGDLKNKLVENLNHSWSNSVSTISSLSYSILREALNKSIAEMNIENYKYNKIGQNLGFLSSYDRSTRSWINGSLQAFGGYEEPAIKNASDFIDIIDKLRLGCLEPTRSNVESIVKRFNIDINRSRLEEITRAVKECLEVGYKQTFNGIIDFVDQIHAVWLNRDLPEFRLAIKSWAESLSLIAIDEAQDTDPLQMEVIKLLQTNKNFIIPVGDKYQAVYSFRGCVEDGLNDMQSLFNCDRLPLPINYRCGINHLKLVRNLYPNIEIQARPNAPEGEIKCVLYDDLITIIDPNKEYLGICRRNAPLLATAIKFLCHKLPAKIKDDKLGGKIKLLVSRIYQKLRKKYKPDLFDLDLDEYIFLEQNRLLGQPDSEKTLSHLEDMRQCLIALYETYSDQLLDLESWKTVVDSICDQDSKSPIGLYTGHSGKGAECDNVFWLYPNTQPMVFKNQTAVELQQEHNLIYVMLTRVKKTLWMVLEYNKSGEIDYPYWLPEEYRVIHKVN